MSSELLQTSGIQIAPRKYSSLLAEWLREMGYTHCFMVAGGGCMHLIDGFRTVFTCVPVVHEVAAAIAAEHFNEVSSNGKAFALITTGPGMTNAVTAIAGCYSEHRELLVVAGQVKSTDLLKSPIRQHGVQEVDGASICKSITVASTCLRRAMPKSDFQSLVKSSWDPHPGPVLIEVCLDIQGACVDPVELGSGIAFPPDLSNASLDSVRNRIIELFEALSTASRPILLLGSLVTRQAAWELLPELEQLGIPVMTTTSAIDRLPTGIQIDAGRPGTWGAQRSANLILAQADVVVAVGAQLDLQQTGFNTREYAPSADLYQIFPCDAELTKGSPNLTDGINANPVSLLRELVSNVAWDDADGWGEYVVNVRRAVPVMEPANQPQNGYPSSFEFLQNLSLAANPKDAFALSSSGGSVTGALQTYHIAHKQFATTSIAFGSMGYGVATAIGVATARPEGRTILVEGDGGFCQNLQELATVRRHNMNVKIFILENDGYASIRATQRKFFGGAYVGCDQETGLGFPDWVRLFDAFGIPARTLEPHEISVERLRMIMDSDGPEAWILYIDPEQSNWPAITSRILPDGGMESSPLHEMAPPLDPELHASVTKYL